MFVFIVSGRSTCSSGQFNSWILNFYWIFIGLFIGETQWRILKESIKRKYASKWIFASAVGHLFPIITYGAVTGGYLLWSLKQEGRR